MTSLPEPRRDKQIKLKLAFDEWSERYATLKFILFLVHFFFGQNDKISGNDIYIKSTTKLHDSERNKFYSLVQNVIFEFTFI